MIVDKMAVDKMAVDKMACDPNFQGEQKVLEENVCFEKIFENFWEFFKTIV